MRIRLLTAVSFLALARAGAQAPSHPMLVSTGWLAQHLADPTVVVLHVGHDRGDYTRGHIPGARLIAYDDVTIEHNGIGTELPPVEQLQRTFEKLGVSDSSHVVIYSHAPGMAPMASRVFFTLDFLGHPRISLLNGGLAKWRAEGRAISTDDAKFSPGRLTPRPRTVTVDADWVSSRAGKQGYAFIDTRTDPEYLGAGERGGLRSEGHVAGARQLQWQQLFTNANDGVFLEQGELAKLFADRVAPGDTVVTYCLVGYRASMTYFGARLLGYPVRLYDGSYQDWARRALPVKKGATP
jgi:thiosulfate/3-mercaptopyruvate sulfurtransferase